MTYYSIRNQINQIQEVCVEKCGDGFFNNAENFCTPCHAKCLQCEGIYPNQCTKCRTGSYFYENHCLYICPKYTSLQNLIQDPFCLATEVQPDEELKIEINPAGYKDQFIGKVSTHLS